MTEEDSIMQTSLRLAEDFRKAFGGDLLSVILYGSAVTEAYVPRKSDLNFLVVLSEKGIEKLHLAHEPTARWRVENVGTPLFLTKAYIASSKDTFPIEFLNIQNSYRVIMGEDVLAGLSLQKNFIRLQCERELKSKLLYLRERYVETQGKTEKLLDLIASSIPTFVFIFKALAYLFGHPMPAEGQEAVSLLSKETGLDERLFSTLLRVGETRIELGAAETEEIFRSYLKEIRKLSLLIDETDVAAS